MVVFKFLYMLHMLEFASHVCCYFFNIKSTMVNKHSEFAKKQSQDRYGRFASPSSRITLPPSRQEVRSCSRCRTAHSSCQEEALSDDSIVEMWEVPPPPPTCLEEVSSNDSPSAYSSYNNECIHIKEVSSYELLLGFNCLV
jgi:hypothetical protein